MEILKLKYDLIHDMTVYKNLIYTKSWKKIRRWTENIKNFIKMDYFNTQNLHL